MWRPGDLENSVRSDYFFVEENILFVLENIETFIKFESNQSNANNYKTNIFLDITLCL